MRRIEALMSLRRIEALMSLFPPPEQEGPAGLWRTETVNLGT